ncbi:LOW QUALITY PROTEIN: hypothetical protein HID58_092800 [Brassica napus]|uniref:Uncharacterized protein n=1 Tax=Brassica napus TaxID=3708 RepID=A0ABQ7XFB4_BRANA|nr:LOW QUALITY PROTEIN: hypothetical protein HID58_092800 [Brassica napus]
MLCGKEGYYVSMSLHGLAGSMSLRGWVERVHKACTVREVARKHAPSCDTLSGIHGHSQSPLPASSYSNEQPRRRGNQEAEIPLGILVDLFTQMLRQSRGRQLWKSHRLSREGRKCGSCGVAAEAKYESKRKGVSGQKGKQIVQFKDSSQQGLSRKRSHDSYLGMETKDVFIVERLVTLLDTAWQRKLLESMLRHVVSLVVLHFAARKVARVCPYVAGQRGCIKHALYGEVARKHALSFDTLSGLHVSYGGCSNPCAFVAAS